MKNEFLNYLQFTSNMTKNEKKKKYLNDKKILVFETTCLKISPIKAGNLCCFNVLQYKTKLFCISLPILKNNVIFHRSTRMHDRG